MVIKLQDIFIAQSNKRLKSPKIVPAFPFVNHEMGKLPINLKSFTLIITCFIFSREGN